MIVIIKNKRHLYKIIDYEILHNFEIKKFKVFNKYDIERIFSKKSNAITTTVDNFTYTISLFENINDDYKKFILSNERSIKIENILK